MHYVAHCSCPPTGWLGQVTYRNGWICKYVTFHTPNMLRFIPKICFHTNWTVWKQFSWCANKFSFKSDLFSHQKTRFHTKVWCELNPCDFLMSHWACAFAPRTCCVNCGCAVPYEKYAACTNVGRGGRHSKSAQSILLHCSAKLCSWKRETTTRR